MLTQTTRKRPLADLTAQECQTLFAVAFGYPPLEKGMQVAVLFDALGIGDDAFTMMLLPEGHIYAWHSMTSAKIHLTVSKLLKLISNLDAMNVAFGPHCQQPGLDRFQPLAQTQSKPPGLG